MPWRVWTLDSGGCQIQIRNIIADHMTIGFSNKNVFREYDIVSIGTMQSAKTSYNEGIIDNFMHSIMLVKR